MSETKSDIAVLEQMVTQNLDIRSSTNLIEMKTHNAGGLVTMGVDRRSFNDLMRSATIGQTHYCVMYIINKKQFDSIKKS
ncbi:hypothetical protein [Mucilaginibacter sp. L3T2-6]|uniref:hypothetical protein n=1 Tax=Mucilaginibacter sp. L3T2-6 TaxID=3062491 RepID=UPI0026755C79|nr:hypothetical protein [Mucilaginibacter sp. L3T2-6]MDO3641951.1 hypothetical protein [Mucilaginibacter sp. L3T2-6]MDV6214371.1 hypothetical protein [Mucilaginibacter sp. L3T2-6]